MTSKLIKHRFNGADPAPGAKDAIASWLVR